MTTKGYGLLVAVTLLVYWAVWPVRPDLSNTGFKDECVVKMGDVAELEDGTMICVKGRKVVLREVPLVKTRRARRRR